MIAAWTRNHSYLLIFLASVAATSGVIANAFMQRKQFYPAVVYISKSNASMAAVYFQGLTMMFLAWKITRWIFFGQLRPAEVEHLVEKSWFALTETCLAFTVFRDDFSSHFVALFTLLLFLKCLHWLAEDRVDFMERTPVISRVFHLRVIGLIFTLGLSDMFFTAYAYHSLVTKGVSVQLVFGFEYAVLCTSVVFITIKYALHCIDLANDQTPWDRKSAVLLYSELSINFFKVVLYATFLVLMMRVNNFPLFAIRPMYMAVKSFKKALYDVIMSRKAIHMMNTLYPDATLEEIRAGDTTCIICREEMISGCKRLPCNHIFHTHCLRSWFQRQQTCPTCRLDILRPVRVTAFQPAAAGAQPPPAPPANGQNNAPLVPPPGGVPPVMFPPGGLPFNFQLPPPPAPGAVPMFQVPLGPAPPGAPRPAAPFPPQFPGVPFPHFPGAPVPPQFPGGPFPSMFPPMWPNMPLPVPPMPVPNFAALSDQDLTRLEGDQRRALELRVTHLRNIQALLDAAVIQFTQYISLIPPSVGLSPQPSGANASQLDAQQNSDAAPYVPLESAPPTSGNSAPQNISASRNVRTDASSQNESDEVRRRRLNRFA
ncbi:E3 ubiquitin-protein ligase synoviolin-like [Paramacrobiotus metropolitanus]|uniref:E3 ubiquitin-protein ligase synoviolin-like n=1 Tax=Paramacrobiotus metropolitanus TaxID=2943436 RepID=UPI002445C269|nr:E3 ubiquitin-protein ligase synoviolin-like [Paramacrobiotus metropolitanus]XP_055355510.1 E3 ubiquitin-protein ligase synoviolin-like [Paramacrobiotus metropolitanus]